MAESGWEKVGEVWHKGPWMVVPNDWHDPGAGYLVTGDDGPPPDHDGDGYCPSLTEAVALVNRLVDGDG